MAKRILARDKKAEQFYREIGKKPNGRPHRFYLGDDEKKAVASIARLEALWEGVETRWAAWRKDNMTDAPFPCWDELTLALGDAIRKGEWTVAVEPPEDDPQVVAAWLAALRTYFPVIQVQVRNPDAAGAGNRELAEVWEREAALTEAAHAREMRTIKANATPFGGQVPTRETLHDALDAYKAWTERTFVDVEGRTTQSGKKQGERAARIKRYATDMPLSDFGTHEIDAVIEFWRTRPKKPTGGVYAFSLCKHTIRLFKHFLRWLHKEKSFPWKKPVDLDLDRVKIVKDKETKYKVDTYDKAELALLWQHASYFERRLLLLALNCGFSISEIGSLDWSEVEGGYIKGLRPKTKVYGEFKLWDITRQALGEPRKKGPVFVTEGGLSLIALTKGNNRSAKISSAWYRLLRRVEKHNPGFKRLGFHHLRKTAGDQVRKFADGETAGVFLRHGKPVKTDGLIDVYSNPVFPRVFDAQDKMWEFWKDIFTPLGEVELPRKLSPAKIKHIRSLKTQGVKTKVLSEMFKISPDMVRRYCRKKK